MDWAIRLANERAARALLDAGNYTGAEARLQNMLAQYPNDARALALLGLCKLRQDNKKEALELARQAACFDPNDLMVRRVLSFALMRNDLFKESEAIAASIAADDPEDSTALLSLAIAKQHKEDWYSANALMDQAQEMARGDVSSLLAIADVRLQQWRYEDAEDLARQALNIDPGQGFIYFILGECALARKAPAEAYDFALEALRLDPNDQPTMKLLSRARARRSWWLRPFLPGIDWIVEMDRTGLLLLPPVFAIIAYAAWGAYERDQVFIARGAEPVVFIWVGLALLLAYCCAVYAAAALIRLRIRHDLRKTALPNF